MGCGRQNITRAQISDADGVLELLWLLFTTLHAAARRHQDLALENLLYAINSQCSPVRLAADRALGFASGTSWCGSWLADSAPAGASI